MASENKTDAAGNPVKKFLETTSVKGVPRMMKSGSYVFRILWGLAVIAGACIAFYFLTKLFILYFSYKVNISVEEMREKNLVFPSVTLCNLNPLANMDVNTTELQGFLIIIASMLYNDELPEDERRAIAELLEPAPLIENVIKYFPSNDSYNFIVTCRWESNMYNEQACISSARRYIYTTDAGYCFTFDPPSNASYVDGFSAILYIDNSLEVNFPNFELALARPLSAGAMATVHQTGTLPDLQSPAILSVGENTEINLKLTRRIKEPSPYSTCSSSDSLPGDVPYIYTWQSCIELCFQELVQEACGCVAGQVLSSESMQEMTDFCHVVNFEDEENLIELQRAATSLAERISCIDDVLSDSERCDPHCSSPCLDERYEMTTSKVAWPHTAYQLAFWYEYIRNQSYSHRFTTYQEHFESLGSAREDIYDALHILTDIRENFLQVHVQFSTDMVTVLEDKPALTLESMLGNLGGTLNLWIGISFVTLVELIDMILNVCTTAGKRCKGKNKVENDGNEAT